MDENLAKEQIGNLMLHALQHKEENIKALLEQIAFAEKTSAGLKNFLEILEPGTVLTNEQLGKMVKTLTKTVIKQGEGLRQLSTLMLILVGSTNFDASASELAIKFGKGDEALRAFVKNKFGIGK